jgi:NAD(P)-dependent dehydrogenase (short-subunit alcohol dehydrogenase family)
MTGATYPDLNGRSVLVTGGGSGIGASIVEHFAEQGARVGFVDIAREASEKLVEEIAAKGHHRPFFAECDLRDIAALKAAVAAIRDAIGPIGVLVNNAAHDDRHDIDDVTPDYWDDRMAVNLRHQFFAAQAVYPDMAAAGGGSIVNLGSISWMLGVGNMPAYTTAKSAVTGLTRSLARRLGPMNIRVNTVLPGAIITPRQIELWLDEEADAERARGQCLPRKLYPADVARIVLFLASEQASACTSQDFIVDGGWA